MMSLFKRLFPASKATPIDEEALFLQRLKDHRSRMLGGGPEHVAFLREHLSDKILADLSPMAAEKMRLTRADREGHSFMLASDGICYVVYTIPGDIQEAPGWFDRKYGGYTKIIEACWNSDLYRNFNCQVLCHFTVGLTQTGAWLNVTIIPFRSHSFSFSPILALDLMNPAEKAQLGISAS